MGNNLGSYSEYTFAAPLSVMRLGIPGSYSGEWAIILEAILSTHLHLPSQL
jgi:hypothetical protein